MHELKYFRASRSEMSDLLPGQRRCDICGEVGECFSLERALAVPKGAGVGCFSCLSAGRFGFFHITEVGYLEEAGLTTYEDDEVKPARLFVVGATGQASLSSQPAPPPPSPAMPPSAAVKELRRTPAFPTWNEVAWPVHCADFMCYLGTWQPGQLRESAAARGLAAADHFAEICGEAPPRWVSLEEDQWGLTFHVFSCIQCPHCGARSTWTETLSNAAQQRVATRPGRCPPTRGGHIAKRPRSS